MEDLGTTIHEQAKQIHEQKIPKLGEALDENGSQGTNLEPSAQKLAS